MSDSNGSVGRSRRRRAPYLGPTRRRPQVLAIARSLFAGGGYAGTSMADIAAVVGASKAVIYDCFPGGKEQIYRRLLDDALAAFKRERARHAQGGRLERELKATLAFADANREAARILFGEPGTTDPHIVEAQKRARRLAFRELAGGSTGRLERDDLLFARCVVSLALQLEASESSGERDRDSRVSEFLAWLRDATNEPGSKSSAAGMKTARGRAEHVQSHRGPRRHRRSGTVDADGGG